jgi:hypothetical protein
VRAVKIRQLPAKWESRHPPIRQHRLLSTSNADPRRNDRARLGGVLIGIFASYFTTRMTINAQQQQIVAQYRRDKRQDIYANVLTQLSGVKTAYNNIVSDIAMDSFAFSFLQGTSAQPVTAPHDAPDLAKKYGPQWHSAWDEFNATFSSAELFSSRHFIEVAKALSDVYSRKYLEAVHPVYPDDPDKTPAARDRVRVQRDVQFKIEEMGKMDGPPYDPALAQKGPYELAQLPIKEAKDELALND